MCELHSVDDGTGYIYLSLAGRRIRRHHGHVAMGGIAGFGDDLMYASIRCVVAYSGITHQLAPILYASNCTSGGLD